MVKLEFFSQQVLVESDVPLKIEGNKLYAWSKKHDRWIELAERWWVESERSMATSHIEVYRLFEDGKVVETAKTYSVDEFWRLSENIRAILVSGGYELASVPYTHLHSYAWTKSGYELKNFHYVDHKLYADIYR